MMAAYYLIMGTPVMALGLWLVRSERNRDMALGAVCVFAGSLLMLNSLLEILWPMR